MRKGRKSGQRQRDEKRVEERKKKKGLLVSYKLVGQSELLQT